jgi:metallo-beta-lactamase class B
MMRALAAVLFMLGASAVGTSQAPQVPCERCAFWNAPQKPFRIFGNTYYVGPHGLSSVLIASDGGLILIDGGLAESAPVIAGNIRALGFRIEDVKLIVNSHVHHDHAGGIAELQRMSGATVVASPWSAAVLRAGGVAKDDPQVGDIRGIAPVANVHLLKDGETLHVGTTALTAHLTPGHTLGGTSWTWTSCDVERCLNMVYADSLSAVSRDGFRFSDHPELLTGFTKSFAFLNTTPCDVLLTPHPDASYFWERTADGLHEPAANPAGCKALAADVRDGLRKRLAKENPKATAP